MAAAENGPTTGARPAGGGTSDPLGDIAAGLAAQAWLDPSAVALLSLTDAASGAHFDAAAVEAAGPPYPASDGARGWVLLYVLDCNGSVAATGGAAGGARRAESRVALPPPGVVVQRVVDAFTANASAFNATLGPTAARWSAGGGYGGFRPYFLAVTLYPAGDPSAAAVAGAASPALLAAWLAAGGDGGPFSPPPPPSASAAPEPALIQSANVYRLWAAIGGSLGLLLLLACCCFIVVCVCWSRRRRAERLAHKRRLDAGGSIDDEDHMAGSLALAAVRGAAEVHMERVAHAEAAAAAAGQPAPPLATAHLSPSHSSFQQENPYAMKQRSPPAQPPAPRLHAGGTTPSQHAEPLRHTFPHAQSPPPRGAAASPVSPALPPLRSPDLALQTHAAASPPLLGRGQTTWSAQALHPPAAAAAAAASPASSPGSAAGGPGRRVNLAEAQRLQW